MFWGHRGGQVPRVCEAELRLPGCRAGVLELWTHRQGEQSQVGVAGGTGAEALGKAQ